MGLGAGRAPLLRAPRTSSLRTALGTPTPAISKEELFARRPRGGRCCPTPFTALRRRPHSWLLAGRAVKNTRAARSARGERRDQAPLASCKPALVHGRRFATRRRAQPARGKQQTARSGFTPRRAVGGVARRAKQRAPD